MEGWYVRKLILDSIPIRSRIYSKADEDSWAHYYFEDSLPSSLEDDTYLDLLDVESKIKLLMDKKVITLKEKNILDLLLEGKSYSDTARSLRKSRLNIIHTFNNLCAKISYYLGDHFTNEGYIDYIIEKYKLDSNDIEILRRYISND